MAEKILELISNSSSKIEYLDNRPGDVMRLYADPALFNKMTNWKPKMLFDDGLLKTIQWFKSRTEGVSALLNQETGINWK